MTTTSEPPPTLRIRTPVWAFAPLGLILVFAAGLGVATLGAMALTGAGFGVAQGLTPAAIAATGLTALELGRKISMGEIESWPAAMLRGARAWGAVGGAWPLAWAVAFAIEGTPGNVLYEALRVILGLLVGLVAGVVAVRVAGAFVLVQRAEPATAPI
jgi:hypothetical protein